MKKMLLVVMMLGLVMLAGCGSVPASEAEAPKAAAVATQIPVDLEIKEKMFIAQTNDVYLNTDEYLGKTIQYEGIFDSFYYPPTDTTYCRVMRYGPGCCGNDGSAGFEVSWQGDGIQMPEPNDWVEVIGVLEEYEEEGFTYLRLDVLSLKVLAVRGAETVTQ
ncbi:MAG: hypothetical protein FWF69_03830 [Firmicutes bacterium]|nr:hypothetical protein [Bacillota bacterium]